MNRFKAPWSPLLHVISWTTTAVCLFISVAGAGARQPRAMSPFPSFIDLLPVALLLGSALFTIRGYVITPDEILVERLLWNTVLKRQGLVSATVDPEALKQSLRTCGNGGLFAFSGFYWNRRLRTFRAFVTDPRLCVVLAFQNRTVVVSPDYPISFCHTLRTPLVENATLSGCEV